MTWSAENDRPMPWKGEKNPYFIWLSEIILQQTRVEQGWAYYERFRERFPKVKDLAEAPEDVVMKMWEGLGYYSRARNLHATAKYIQQEYQGIFPKTYDAILALKGIGPYTAAAISSFAFNLPHAVVDGNVYRVLSRYFGISTPIDSSAGKKEFAALAQQLLDSTQAGTYNQAIIDFGATQCKPKNPDCSACPMNEQCQAYADDLVQTLPIKAKKIVRRTRHFNYLILNYNNHQWIQKRIHKDIWQNLYEFPLIESDHLLTLEEIMASDFGDFHSKNEVPKLLSKKGPFKQQLTHQNIIANFWSLQLHQRPDFLQDHAISVLPESLSNYAFPNIIDLYLQDNSLYLELH